MHQLKTILRRHNRKKPGKLLQQCATRIDAVFHPFLVDTSINRKKILYSFLKSTNIFLIKGKNNVEAKHYLMGQRGRATNGKIGPVDLFKNENGTGGIKDK